MSRSTFFKIFVVLTTIIFSLSLFASSEDVPRKEDHEALRALKSGVVEAVNSRDMDKLLSFFSKDFVFTTVTQKALTNPAAVKEFYETMMTAPNSPVTSIQVSAEADILTSFLGDQAGYCYGTAKEVYTLRSNGRVVTMNTRWTAVVSKETGNWKIKAVHIGADVMDNPILNTASLSAWKKFWLFLGFGKYPGE